jgi:hypothetical protein
LQLKLILIISIWLNRHLWNEGTIQEIMDRPQPAPVAEVDEEVQEPN